MKQQLLTQAAYGRYRQVSRARVGQWVRAGRIELINGKIDPREADRSLEETISTANECKAPPIPLCDDGDDPHDIRMMMLWQTFWDSLDQLWKELRRGTPADRKLRRDSLLDTVRNLK